MSKGYPPPPLPEDWWARLGRLEDRTRLSLEDFTRRRGLPLERANRLRFHDVPTAAEIRAIMGVGLLGPGWRRGAAAGLGRTLALPEVEGGAPPAVRLSHRAGGVFPGLPPPAGPLPEGRRVQLEGSGPGAPCQRPHSAPLESRGLKSAPATWLTCWSWLPGWGCSTTSCAACRVRGPSGSGGPGRSPRQQFQRRAESIAQIKYEDIPELRPGLLPPAPTWGQGPRRR